MRVPIEWLKEYVTVRLTPTQLAHRLTMAGLEVVGIRDVDGQPVLDLEITPNRADCLSIIGVAREVAAITRQRLRLPKAQGSRLKAEGKSKTRQPLASNLQPPASFTIRIEDRKGCRRYIGRLIDGVTIRPSPAWMQRRLLACGARPINNIVDITNYVLLEYGQPLHAFDFARLSQGTILVRRAKARESLTTLDEERRTLSPDTLVIADAERAVAIAGIMGGLGSEVLQQTKTVLLESALFDPLAVRRTSRALGLRSESSYRFERGIDPVGVEAASRRASALIQELAGGRETVVRDVGTQPSPRASITITAPQLNRWVGHSLNPPAIRTALAQLACRVSSSGDSSILRVTPPSFRQDLTQEVDLYEEIARLIGYDRIASTIPLGAIVQAGSEQSAAFRKTQSLKCVCASVGLTETINWSLVSESDLARYGYLATQATRLSNPLSQDHAYLRPSLLIGLLQTIRRNVTRGAPSVRIFEVGMVMPLSTARPGDHSRRAGEANKGTPCAERLQVGLGLSGWWLRDWRRKDACDFWVLKGLLQAIIGRLCESPPEFLTTSRPWAQPGACAEIRLNGRTIGVAGEVSRRVTDELDLGQGAWIAELEADALLASASSPTAVTAPTAFPSVKRDLSLLVREATSFEEVAGSIREVGGRWAHRVELIDRFTKGAQVPRGSYSLTFSIEYRDATRTLTAAEVDTLHQRIGQALVSRLGATLR